MISSYPFSLEEMLQMIEAYRMIGSSRSLRLASIDFRLSSFGGTFTAAKDSGQIQLLAFDPGRDDFFQELWLYVHTDSAPPLRPPA